MADRVHLVNDAVAADADDDVGIAVVRDADSVLCSLSLDNLIQIKTKNTKHERAERAGPHMSNRTLKASGAVAERLSRRFQEIFEFLMR
jgi:hypothetical protein